ncbi:hypothetical protein C5Y97_29660 [Blastopirellula marina]|uniref:Uncharacterized protein n=1 Tax=Blastopirellula marina TaxID=124 RepID=A0A2S8F3P1_9BACT|nr:hypothetical protein C5Y98_29645 [Blastopirellula marina]PTL40865.1 hypothetical protein C5Y97_29660 [Blastopirellula marina]
MNTGHIEEAVVIQMQKDCKQNVGLSDIVQRARTSLGTQGEHTLVILRHFMAAFGLSLKDARLLEACSILGGTAMSVAEVDTLLRPKMLDIAQNAPLGS